jgi:hypothetical protein
MAISISLGNIVMLEDDTDSGQPDESEYVDAEDRAPPAMYAFRDRHGYEYLQFRGGSTVHRLDAPGTKLLVFQEYRARGVNLRPHELKQEMELLRADALLNPDVRDVWQRVGPIPDGVEIDVGDATDNRIRVTARGVEVVAGGPETLFHRSPTTKLFTMPAAQGDLSLLDPYVNLERPSAPLLRGWLSYVVAHPKDENSKFPILVLGGEQGSGKSFLCRRIQDIIDPSRIGIQTLPRGTRDLALVVQQAHVSVFDNVRGFTPLMADNLCVTATGGSRLTRRLRTDGELYVATLHGALVLNGIHSFIDQPDLAQRCLPLTLRSLDDGMLRSEASLMQDFSRDLPRIVRGLLDLVAGILAYLPGVPIMRTERMIDFVTWLAAMERVDGVQEGEYQSAYSTALSHGMLDSLLDDPMAVAVLELIDGDAHKTWSGTPSVLFATLERRVSRRIANSNAWPKTVNALSKGLRSMQCALRRQGVEVRWKRGKQRQIVLFRRDTTADGMPDSSNPTTPKTMRGGSNGSAGLPELRA